MFLLQGTISMHFHVPAADIHCCHLFVRWVKLNIDGDVYSSSHLNLRLNIFFLKK
jgi:hypothetical protein